ncbi:hypothetical protein F4780DRAFT_785020 [Xylariomycetidae sp. FL0641]|nr:hypothetical protein F4780DRAFT_785020 [Xylariomycetidae sp. FL0641]
MPLGMLQACEGLETWKLAAPSEEDWMFREHCCTVGDLHDNLSASDALFNIKRHALPRDPSLAHANNRTAKGKAPFILGPRNESTAAGVKRTRTGTVFGSESNPACPASDPMKIPSPPSDWDIDTTPATLPPRGTTDTIVANPSRGSTEYDRTLRKSMSPAAEVFPASLNSGSALVCNQEDITDHEGGIYTFVYEPPVHHLECRHHTHAAVSAIPQTAPLALRVLVR